MHILPSSLNTTTTMWNCLRMKGRIIKVVKMDGKVLEYTIPIKVHDVLSQFSVPHGISTSYPVSKYLQPTTELTGGNVYYLVPLSNHSPELRKKVVRFSTPEPEEVESPRKSTRLKLVISKQELKELIKNGAISFDRVIASQLEKEDAEDKGDDDSFSNRTWKPVLNSIPETDYSLL